MKNKNRQEKDAARLALRMLELLEGCHLSTAKRALYLVLGRVGRMARVRVAGTEKDELRHRAGMTMDGSDWRERNRQYLDESAFDQARGE